MTDVHAITVVNVHPCKDPSPSQMRRAKIVVVHHSDASEAQSRALDAAPRSWDHPTIIRHTVNGEDI